MVDRLTANDFIQIALLIGKFQALEVGIKIYLIQNQIKQDRQNNQLKNSYSIGTVDDLPYGTLLKRYKRISHNQELYDRLFLLKDYRNFLAHKSLLAASNMSSEMKQFIGVHMQKPLDYQALSQELDKCILLFGKQIHSS